MLEEQKDRYLSLGRNIARFRKFHGYTQFELAEKLNVSRVHISRIEIGKVAISLDIVFKICDVLSVSPKELFDFDESDD